MNQPARDIAKLIRSLAHRHQPYEVFRDFVEMSACALSNAVDIGRRTTREEQYMRIVPRYTKEELHELPKLLGMLIMALEAEPADVLGLVFHELELHNKYQGQFFTPQALCDLMAAMTLGDTDQLKREIDRRGFITVSEPACGSAATVIGICRAMQRLQINYQQSMHVTCTDVDLKAVHMAYVQLSLLHVPAVIYHGNTLSMEMHDAWYTPAHILGFWDMKLRRQIREQQHEEPRTIRRQLLPEVERGISRKRLLPPEQRG